MELINYNLKSNHAAALSSTIQSLFIHDESVCAMPYVSEYRVLSHSGSTPVFGSVAVWKYNDVTHLVGRNILRLRVSALSGGINPRFVDYMGCFCINTLQTFSAGNML